MDLIYGCGFKGVSMFIQLHERSNLVDGLQQLIELNFDVIEAYDAAIRAAKGSTYQIQLSKFRADHEFHIHNISRFIRHRLTASQGANILTHCPKVLANPKFSFRSFINSLIFRKNNVKKNLPWRELEILIAKVLKDLRRHVMWFEAHEKELFNYIAVARYKN